jgi:Zn finger protein HypA/HybF involved in hydrogenase expression
MKAHKEFKNEVVVCENCNKSFHPRYSSFGKFCCKKCSSEFKKKDTIRKWKLGEITGTKNYSCSTFIRNYLMEKHNDKCQLCGWGIKNIYTNKVPLQIHHIDGNSENNREDNLQLLCPNCHSLTENYGSRNKNAPRGKSIYYGKAKG